MTEAEFTTAVMEFVKEMLNEGWSEGEIRLEMYEALRFYAIKGAAKDETGRNA